MFPKEIEEKIKKVKKLKVVNTNKIEYKFNTTTSTLFIPINEIHFAKKFQYFDNLEEIELHIHNEVDDAYAMFNQCINLKKIKFTAKLDLERVYDLSYFFSECSSLTEIDLSNILTSNVLNQINYMFSYCTSLKAINFGNYFHSENVENASKLFFYCRSLETVNWADYQPFNNLQHAKEMFTGNEELKKIDLRGLNFNNIVTMSQMFYDASPELEVLVNSTFKEEMLYPKN